mmetsp:Transcript_17726/g.44684  ORF Transcript_17726/g.44684 Transcript_17726/m.44684 type:complete len:147 (-) Transcript_17726:840-1280(-)
MHEGPNAVVGHMNAKQTITGAASPSARSRVPPVMIIHFLLFLLISCFSSHRVTPPRSFRALIPILVITPPRPTLTRPSSHHHASMRHRSSGHHESCLQTSYDTRVTRNINPASGPARSSSQGTQVLALAKAQLAGRQLPGALVSLL